MTYRFNKELYPRAALLKAAYQFTDKAYIHLDADKEYYYVSLEPKDPNTQISEKDYLNEMISQSVRHEIYLQTKNIRELMLARAMATTVITDSAVPTEEFQEQFNEDDIVKDWFAEND